MPRFCAIYTFALISPCLLPAQSVNYSEHIAPIIYNNCSSCHRPNEIGPFSLLSYSDVVRHALTIGATTQTHYMPPWKPEPGWSPYRGERRLSDTQISLIQQWIAAGAPQGDPSKEPPLPQFVDGWQLGTPDLILEMPAGYTVPAEGTDIYRNFVVPTGLTQDKWVKAIELKPTATSVLHHVLFFSDTTGSARKMDGQDGQPGFPGLGTVFTLAGSNVVADLTTAGLGGWVPGTTPAFLPDGIAMPLPKGSDLLLQTHFHLNGIQQTEKTVIGLYFGPAPARTLTQVQVPAFFGIRANIDIPAGLADYKVRSSFTLPVDVDAVTVSSHMHYLGKEAKLTATLPNGDVQILLWIRDWDFRWQGTYTFQNFLTLPKGTRLDGELVYDNSSNNPWNPNSPPIRVQWGEQSTDEMGSMILSVVPHQQSDLNSLVNSIVNFVLTPVPQVGNKPLFVSSGMVDGASTQPGAVTPGKIVVLYGSRIGPSTLASAQLGSDGRLSNNLGNTQVFFDGVAAPLLYASSGQLAAVVPYGVGGKTGTQVQVRSGGLSSDVVAMPVKPTGPSVFSSDYTGSGQGAILNQDGVTVNSSAAPAGKGSVVSIFATGEGQTTPSGIDGLLATGAYPKPVSPVQVFINGNPAEVLYAGAAPNQIAGLFQVNVRIPADAPSGDVPVQIQVGNAASQPGITVAVK
jgi:uncharacterized protein (TIGR03437 family)